MKKKSKFPKSPNSKFREIILNSKYSQNDQGKEKLLTCFGIEACFLKNWRENFAKEEEEVIGAREERNVS